MTNKIIALTFVIVVVLSLFLIIRSNENSTNCQEFYLVNNDTLLIQNNFKSATFTFTNWSEEKISFWLNEEGKNLKNIHSIIKTSIPDSSISDYNKAVMLWKLVSNAGFHHPFNFDQRLNDNYHPLALLRFPFFLCGEKAQILAALLREIGLKTRIVFLNEHIVTEVYFNSSWHLFDADKKVYYKGLDGLPYSAAEIILNPTMISSSLLVFADESSVKNISEYQNFFNCTPIYDLEIPNFENIPKNMDVTLMNNESITYSLENSGFVNRFIYKDYLFKTRGWYLKHIQSQDERVQVIGDGCFLYKDSIPYYIKKIEVLSGENIELVADLILQDRINLKEQSHAFTTSFNSLSCSFSAPETTDIYYKYKILFCNTNIQTLQKLDIKIYFEFNSITFPLTPGKTSRFELINGDSLQLLSKY